MLRRHRVPMSLSSKSACCSAATAMVNWSCTRFPSSSTSASNNHGSNTSNASDKNSRYQPSTYFVSQRGSLFFTSTTFSTIRNIRNTLMVPEDQQQEQQVVAENNQADQKKRGKGGKKQQQQKQQQRGHLSPNSTARSAQGITQLRNIATQGRILRTYRGTLQPDDDSNENLFTRITNMAFFESLFGSRTNSNNNSAHASAAPPPANLPPLPQNFARRKWWYAMMPTGYPHSVSQGFARFFVLNIAGCFLAAFSMTLATQALLSSFFAGGTSVGWLLKDILPAFLTAYLAHQFITVERHPREWFIIANCLTQGAVCFDFAIPHIAAAVGNQVLVPLAALTSFVKGLAMLILTTSRTALVQSFSREGNLVELAKRLHGMLVLVYPLASGVALCIPLFFSLSTAATAVLVALSSAGCIAVAVSMVRRMYPKLLNTECAVESCRRHIARLPVIRAAEAPSVALFHRRVFRVPFKIGLSLSAESVAARKAGEAIAVVSFNYASEKASAVAAAAAAQQAAAANSNNTTTTALTTTMTATAAAAPSPLPPPPASLPLNKVKYLFVFRKDRAQLKKEHDRQQLFKAIESGSTLTPEQVELLRQVEEQERSNNFHNLNTGEEDLTPAKFIGVVYDVSATFTDVMEGVYAALSFVEPRDENGELLTLAADNNSADTDHPISAASSTFASSSSSSSPRVFLKKPPPHEVHSLVQQLASAGWQVRAHQIDDRDLRVEIQRAAPMPAAAVATSATVAAATQVAESVQLANAAAAAKDAASTTDGTATGKTKSKSHKNRQMKQPAPPQRVPKKSSSNSNSSGKKKKGSRVK